MQQHKQAEEMQQEKAGAAGLLTQSDNGTGCILHICVGARCSSTTAGSGGMPWQAADQRPARRKKIGVSRCCSTSRALRHALHLDMTRWPCAGTAHRLQLHAGQTAHNSVSLTLPRQSYRDSCPSCAPPLSARGPTHHWCLTLAQAQHHDSASCTGQR